MIVKSDDGRLLVPVAVYSDGGACGDTTRYVEPGDPEYDELARNAVSEAEWLHTHRPLSPGQADRIARLRRQSLEVLERLKALEAQGADVEALDREFHQLQVAMDALRDEPRPGDPGFNDAP